MKIYVIQKCLVYTKNNLPNGVLWPALWEIHRRAHFNFFHAVGLLAMRSTQDGRENHMTIIHFSSLGIQDYLGPTLINDHRNKSPSTIIVRLRRHLSPDGSVRVFPGANRFLVKRHVIRNGQTLHNTYSTRLIRVLEISFCHIRSKIQLSYHPPTTITVVNKSSSTMSIVANRLLQRKAANKVCTVCISTPS